MEVIFLLGTAQALFLAILVFNKKGKSHGDYILGSWLIFMGIHLLNYYLFSTGFSFQHPHLLGIGIGFPLLEAAFMFIYVSVMIRKSGRLKATDLLHLIPFLIITIFFTFRFYVLSSPEKVDFYNQIYNGQLPRDVSIMTFPNIITGPIYVILSLIKLSGHSKSIANDFSYTEQINLNWLKFVIGGLGFVFLVVIVSNVLVRFPFLGVAMHEHLIYFALSISVFFLGYFGIKQQAIYTSDPSVLNEVASRPQKKQKKKASQYLHSGLKQKEAEGHAAEIKDYFEKEKPFLDGKLSLSEVAQHMNISVNHLSQVINEQLRMTFFDFVNSYRVDEVKARLSSPDVKNFTLLGIAYDSGFNSKSSFNSIFKKFTGLTPSQFAKQLTA
jgi:AraC-like DNA-binding protein